MIRMLEPQLCRHLRSEVTITSVAQCVEELLMNSIDAKATCIAVRIDLENFKVQVIDNGDGVEPEQLDMMGQRYATSKCRSLMDLDNLSSYGYRGEALASISDVAAKLEITTRAKWSPDTFCTCFQGGQSKIDRAEYPRPSPGATVTVYRLFHNLPVRRKSLNPLIEYELIQQKVESAALVHPGTTFSLRNDCTGTVTLQTKRCSSSLGAFTFLYGTERAKSMRPVEGSYGKFSLQGYMGAEGSARRNVQFIYVNGRLVLKTRLHKLVNLLLSSTLITRPGQGRNQTGRSQFPLDSVEVDPTLYGMFLLKITCPRNQYDICLDPTRTLIEFTDWDSAFMCVTLAVKDFVFREGLASDTFSDSSEEIEKTFGELAEAVDEAAIKECAANPLSLSCDNNHQRFYGRGISTADCRNNLQSLTVRRKRIHPPTPTSPERMKDDEVSGDEKHEIANDDDITMKLGTTPANRDVSVKLEEANDASAKQIFFKTMNGGDLIENLEEETTTAKYEIQVKEESHANSNYPVKKPRLKRSPPTRLFFRRNTRKKLRRCNNNLFFKDATYKDQEGPSVDNEEHHFKTSQPIVLRLNYSLGPGGQSSGERLFGGGPSKAKSISETLRLRNGAQRQKMRNMAQCQKNPVRAGDQADGNSSLSAIEKVLVSRPSHGVKRFLLQTAMSCDHKGQFQYSPNAKESLVGRGINPRCKFGVDQTLVKSPGVNESKSCNVNKRTPSFLALGQFLCESSNMPASPEDNLVEIAPKIISGSEFLLLASPSNFSAKRGCKTSEDDVARPSSKLTWKKTTQDIQPPDHGEPEVEKGNAQVTIELEEEPSKFPPEVIDLTEEQSAPDSQISPPAGEAPDHDELEPPEEANGLTERVEEHWLCQFDPSLGRNLYVNLLTGNSQYRQPPVADREGSGPGRTLPTASPGTRLRQKLGWDRREKDYGKELEGVLGGRAAAQVDETACKWKEKPVTESPSEDFDRIAKLFGEWKNPVFADSTSLTAPGQASLKRCLNPDQMCKFSKDMLSDMKFVGQVDDKFLACIVEMPSKVDPAGHDLLLVMVDQHAAHERVRLEKFIRESYKEDCDDGLKSRAVDSPISVMVSSTEMRILKGFRDRMEQSGIVFNIIDSNDIQVTRMPMCIFPDDPAKIHKRLSKDTVMTIVTEHLELLKKTSGACPVLPQGVEKILKSMACHGAIKFGDHLEPGECVSLIHSLAQCNLPFQCAHGRPTMIPLLTLKSSLGFNI